jgi:DNA-binding transcriptional MocR family regulator
MKIPLDRQITQPIYLQIRDRIKYLIASGVMQSGDRLPSVRQMAKEAQVNKLTVMEAYSRLEAEGLIHARLGSGYFVNSCSTPTATFAPEQTVIIPQSTSNSFCDSYLTSIQAIEQPDVVDFSIAFPQPFGLEDLQRNARRAMNHVVDSLFNYSSPQGLEVLRQQVAQLLVQRGLAIAADDLIITSGSMQGVSLALRYFLQPGDWVIVESPTWSGTLNILETLGARVIGIPMTPQGMNLELLEQYLQSHRPKLIYTISTLHNPTGITTSLAHRRQLLALAHEYGCIIVEDNAYEGLEFEPVPAPIKAIDRQDAVIYLGSFSKTLMPGLRIGYMVVTGRYQQALIERKILDDMHTPTPSQAIVQEYLASGHFRYRLQKLRALHLQSRNIMLEAISHHFPLETTWTVPQGGVFLWVQLPPSLPLAQICQEVRQQGVLALPGNNFFPDRQGYAAMRLSFCRPIEAIQSGIAILGKQIKCMNPEASLGS